MRAATSADLYKINHLQICRSYLVLISVLRSKRGTEDNYYQALLHFFMILYKRLEYL
jgi:hypothetical protein